MSGKPLSRGIRIQQLLDRVERVPEAGCWIWMGETSRAGYGRFNVGGMRDYVHRWSYRLFIGEIPEGMIVCHRCDVKCCVNPAHLYAGLHYDNTMDIMRGSKAESSIRA